MGKRLMIVLRTAWERDRREIQRVIAICTVLLVAVGTAVSLFLAAFAQTTDTYCGLDHEHTRQCYSDPNADVESSDVWERTLPDEAQDTPRITRLVDVALSQRGYAESQENYLVDGDDVRGYTRYGEWAADPYRDWNATFVDFCLYYAGIDTNLFGAQVSVSSNTTDDAKSDKAVSDDAESDTAEKEAKPEDSESAKGTTTGDASTSDSAATSKTSSKTSATSTDASSASDKTSSDSAKDSDKNSSSTGSKKGSESTKGAASSGSSDKSDTTEKGTASTSSAGSSKTSEKGDAASPSKSSDKKGTASSNAQSGTTSSTKDSGNASAKDSNGTSTKDSTSTSKTNSKGTSSKDSSDASKGASSSSAKGKGEASVDMVSEDKDQKAREQAAQEQAARAQQEQAALEQQYNEYKATPFTSDDDAASVWMWRLSEGGLFAAPTSQPLVGDLVFLYEQTISTSNAQGDEGTDDPDGSDSSDDVSDAPKVTLHVRMGIVTSVDQGTGWIGVVLGDANNAVEERAYALGDSDIVAFGRMPAVLREELDAYDRNQAEQRAAEEQAQQERAQAEQVQSEDADSNTTADKTDDSAPAEAEASSDSAAEPEAAPEAKPAPEQEVESEQPSSTSDADADPASDSAQTPDSDADAQPSAADSSTTTPDDQSSTEAGAKPAKSIDSQVLVAQKDGYTVAAELAGEAGEGYTLKVERLRAGAARLAAVEQGLSKELSNGVVRRAHVDPSDVVIFDITICDKDGNEVELGDAVRIRVTPPDEATLADDAATSTSSLHVSGAEATPEVVHLEGTDPERLDVEADSNASGFSFTTEGLSPFAFVYTVDFEYQGYAWSMAGGSVTKLSDLLATLHAAFDVADVVDVEFSDPDLLRVEPTTKPAGDWLLTSLKPFATEEALTLTLANGDVATIAVTDDTDVQTILGSPTNERNISRFLERVEFYDGNTLVGDSSGPDTMVVRPGHEYTMYLHFKEDEDAETGGQLPDDGIMYYGIPEGVILSPRAFTERITLDGKTAYKTSFDIVIDKKHTLTGNAVTYVPAEGSAPGYLMVEWNTSPDQAGNYKLLKASPRTAFRLNFPWTVLDPGNTTTIPFSEDAQLKVAVDPTYGIELEKVSSPDPSNPEIINYAVEAIADGDATATKFTDVMGAALTYVDGSLQVSYKRLKTDESQNQDYEAFTPDYASSNGGAVTVDADGHGFNFTLNRLDSGHMAYITYQAKVDYTKLGGKNNIDTTSRNTVTATDEYKNVLAEDSTALDAAIDYLQIGKRRNAVRYEATDGAGSTNDWNYMYVQWEVIYNPDHLIHVEGATLKDAVWMGKKYSTSYVTDRADMPFTVVAYEGGTFTQDDGTSGDSFNPTENGTTYPAIPIITPTADNGYGWDDPDMGDATVTEPDASKQQRASWEWTIPGNAGEGEKKPRTYVVTYWTKIAKDGPDSSGYVGNQATENIADITRDKSVELPGDGPGYEIEVDKRHVIDDYTADGKVYTQWEISFPRYGEKERAIVEETLPHILVGDGKGEHVCTDSFVNEGRHVLEVEGLYDGETCVPSVSADGYDVVFWFFKGDPGLAADEHPTIDTPGQGIKAPDATHQSITIRFWTENDKEWIEATSEGLATPEHWNHVHLVLDGKENVADTYAIPKPPRGINKTVEEVGSWTDGTITLPVYRYTLELSGMDEEAFETDSDGNKVLRIDDDFDTNLVYLPLSSLPEAGQTKNLGNNTSVTLSSKNGRSDSDETLVRTIPTSEYTWDATFPSEDPTETVEVTGLGEKKRLPITITLTPEQQQQMQYPVHQYQSRVSGAEPELVYKKDEEGNYLLDGEGKRIPVTVYGKSYKVSYYLAPDFDKIRAEAQRRVLAGENTNTELPFENKATWQIGNNAAASQFSAATTTYDLNPVQKDCAYHPENELANYTIVVNPLQLRMNHGERYSVQDEYSNLAVDFQTVKFTTVPAGRESQIEWSYHNNKGTFWVPDATKVTIEYEGWPVGNRASGNTMEFTNTAKAGVFGDTAPKQITLTADHEGTASSYRVRIFKFENDNMDKPLEGAVFQLFMKNNETGEIEPMRYKVAHSAETGDDEWWAEVNKGRDTTAPFDYESEDSNGYFPTPENHEVNDYIYFVTGDYGNKKHMDEGATEDTRNTEQWGFAEVMLSQARDGVALKKNKQYYLKEVLTPDGHIAEDIYWRFIIGESDDWDNYVYSDDSILQVSNASADRVLTVHKDFVDRTEGSRIKYDPDQKDIQFQIVGTVSESDPTIVYSKTATYSDFKKVSTGPNQSEYLLIIRELPAGYYTVSEVRTSAQVEHTQLATFVEATAATEQVDVQGETIEGTKVDQDTSPVNSGNTSGDDTAFHFTVQADDDITDDRLPKTTAEATFTNIYTDYPPVTIEVSKSWNPGDNGEGVHFRPVKAEFALYAGQEKYDLLPEDGGNDRGNVEVIVGQDAQSPWASSTTITNLPKTRVVGEGADAQVEVIDWSVKEVSATYHTDANAPLENTTVQDEYLSEHFTTTERQSDPVATESGVVRIDADFTNAFNNLTTVQVTKDWTDDSVNAALHQDDVVYFDLYRTTTPITAGTDLRALVTVENLAPVVQDIPLAYGESFTYTNELMEKSNNESAWYYFVLEQSVAGYDDTYGFGPLTQDDKTIGQKITITNTPSDGSKGTLTIKKNVVGLPSMSKSYGFTLTNSGKYLQADGSLGTTAHTFSIDASDANGITIPDVSPGTYVLTEVKDDTKINGYELTSANVKVGDDATGVEIKGTGYQTVVEVTAEIEMVSVPDPDNEGQTISQEHVIPTSVVVTNTYARDASPEAKTDFTFGKLWVMPNENETTTLPWPNDTTVTVEVHRRLKGQDNSDDATFSPTYTIRKGFDENDLVTFAVTPDANNAEGSPTLDVINPDVTTKTVQGADTLVANDMSYHHYEFKLEGLERYDASGNEWEYYAVETSVKGKDKSGAMVELLEDAEDYAQNDAGKYYELAYGVVNGIGAEEIAGKDDAAAVNGNTGYAINRLSITDHVDVAIKKIINGWPNWGERANGKVPPEYKTTDYSYPEFKFYLYYSNGNPVMVDQAQKLDEATGEPVYDEHGNPVMEGGTHLYATTDELGQASFQIPDDAIDQSKFIWWSDEQVLYGTQSFWIREEDPFAVDTTTDPNGQRTPTDGYKGIKFTTSSARVALTIKYDWLTGELKSTASVGGNSYTDANGIERGVIKNTYDPGETQLTVSKTWDDANNQDGYRRAVKFKVNAYYETTTTTTTGEGDEQTTTTQTERHDLDTVWFVKKANAIVTGDNGVRRYVEWQGRDEIILNDTSDPYDASKEYRITLDPPLANTSTTTSKTVKLPKYYEGYEIHYTVTEMLDESPVGDGKTLADKYTKTSTVEGNDQNVTNSHSPESVRVHFQKEWEGNDPNKASRTITVQLKASFGGTVIDSYNAAAANAKWSTYASNFTPVTVTMGTTDGAADYNKWLTDWDGLPRYAPGSGGQQVTYTVEEVDASIPIGYYQTAYDSPEQVEDTTSTPSARVYDQNVTITNTYELVDIPIKKVWEDDNNRDGVRPTSVTYTLSATVDGEDFPVRGTDNQPMTAEALSKSLGTGDVDPNDANIWQGDGWVGLPKYFEGKEIAYTVIEEPPTLPEGVTYTASDTVSTVTTTNAGTENEREQDLRTITNSHDIYTTQIDLTKTWVDQQNQDGVRLSPLDFVNTNIRFKAQLSDREVELKVGGAVPGKSNTYYVVYDDDDDVSTADVQFVDGVVVLEGTNGAYDLSILSDPDALAAYNTYTVTYQTLPRYRDVGTEIAYSLAEVQSGKYNRVVNAGDTTYVASGAAIDMEGTAAQPSDIEKTASVMNKYNPEHIDVTVEKTWEHGQNSASPLPDAATIKLVALSSQGTRIDSEDEWRARGYERDPVAHLVGSYDPNDTSTEGAKWDWTDLPKYMPGAVGESATYHVEEVDVPNGYRVVYNELPAEHIENGEHETVIVTNTYEETSITASKVWDDANNQDGLRQDVQFKLQWDLPDDEPDAGFVDVPAKGAEGSLNTSDDPVVQYAFVLDSTNNTYEYKTPKWDHLLRWKNNQPVTYRVVEVEQPIAGYTTTDAGSAYPSTLAYPATPTTASVGATPTYGLSQTITNTHTPQTYSNDGTTDERLSFAKSWDHKGVVVDIPAGYETTSNNYLNKLRLWVRVVGDASDPVEVTDTGWDDTWGIKLFEANSTRNNDWRSHASVSASYVVTISDLPKYKPQSSEVATGQMLEYFISEDEPTYYSMATAADETVTVGAGTANEHTYQLLKLAGNENNVATLVSGVGMANVRDTANLAVSKTVESELAADHNVPFTFTISTTPQVTGLTANYSYTTTGALGNPAAAGTLTFTNGVSSAIALYSGQTATIARLPVGVTYTVTEGTDARFEETDDVGQPATRVSALTTSNDAIAFTNTRKKGTLEVSKAMASTDDADKTKDFTFTVTLGGLKVDPNVNPETKTFSGVTFTKDANNSFVGTVTLHDGQTKTFDDVPIEATYTVEETADTNYTTNPTTGSFSGSISSTKSTATFENTRKVGDFKIAKTLANHIPSDTGDTFYFDVTVTNANNQPLVLDLSAGEPDVTVGATTLTTSHIKTADPGNNALWYDATNSVIHNVPLVWDSATSADNSVTISGLPQGARCTTVETGFTVPTDVDRNNITKDDSTQTAGAIVYGTPQEVTFTNARATGDLVMKKIVDSPVDTEMAGTYDLQVTLKTKKGNAAVELDDLVVKRQQEGQAESEGTIDFDANGVASIAAVHHNEVITIEGIPTEVMYTISESGASDFTKHFEVKGTGDQYSAIPNGGVEILKDQTSDAQVRNVRNTGELRVSKSVISALPSDKSHAYSFTVVVAPPSTSSGAKLAAGTYGGVTFVNDTTTYNTATFTLADGEEATITGLPTDWTYTVTEATETNITTTQTGDTGTISSTQSNAAFTNTRDTGSLALNKELQHAIVAEAGGDEGDTFYYDVTLSYGANNEKLVLDALAPIQIASDGTTTNLSVLSEGETPAEHQLYYDDTNGVIRNVPVVWHQADATANPAREAGGITTISGLPVGVTYAASELTKTEGDPAVTVIDMTPAAFAAHIEQGATTGDLGSISSTTSEANFSNVRQVGNLQIGKAVVSDLSADHTKDFSFTVTASPALSGEYNVSYNNRASGEVLDKLTFTDGTATGIKLADGQTITIADLPTDVTYTVAETSETGFETPECKVGTGDYATVSANPTCAMTNGQTADMGFKNTRTTKDLTVSKVVHSTVQGDKVYDFKFAVTLSDTTITKSYDTSKHPATGADVTGTLPFTNGVSDVFELKHGESLTIKDLPLTVGYTVHEVTDGTEATNAAKFTVDNDQTGTIVDGTNAKTLTNVRNTDTLTITKSLVNDIPTDEGDTFYFDVVLRGDDVPTGGTVGQFLKLDANAPITVKSDGDATGTVVGTAQAGERPLYYDEATGILHNVPVVWHAADTTTDPVTPAGGTTTIEGLPLGATYVVSEQAYSATEHTGVDTITTPTNITPTSNTGASDTVEDTTQDGQAEYNTAAFVNTRATGDLVIKKTVVSPVETERTTDTYKVQVALATTQGEHLAVSLENVSISRTRTMPDNTTTTSSGTLTFNSSGIANIDDFHHDETITITGIPTDVMYTITEPDLDTTLFENTFAIGVDPTLTDTQTASASADVQGTTKTTLITNTRRLGNLQVSKDVQSVVPSDGDKYFHFVVELSGPTGSKLDDGTYGVASDAYAMTFAHDATSGTSKAEFVLKDDETQTAVGLPVGWTYTVTESTHDGSDGNDGIDVGKFNTTWTRTVASTPTDVLEGTGLTSPTGSNTNAIDTDSSTVAFVNTRKTCDLKLKKNVVSPFDTDKNDLYTFVVTLKHGDESLTGPFDVTTYDASGQQSTSSVTFDAQGTARILVRGRTNQYATIAGVPLDATYAVTEELSAAQDEVFDRSADVTGTILQVTDPYEATITNTRNVLPVSLIKVSAEKSSILLDGAEFSLSPVVAEGQTVSGDWPKSLVSVGGYLVETSNASNPTAEQKRFNLTLGKYRLVETKAPTGYHKLTQPVEFEVLADGVVYRDGLTEYNHSYAPNQSTNVAEVRIANTAGVELPSTGGSGVAGIYVAGVALLVCAATLARIRMRRGSGSIA